MESIANINKTNKAQKKIKTLADNNELDYELTSCLVSFNWNFDGIEGTWVRDSELLKDEEYHRRLRFIQDNIELPDTPLTKKDVTNAILIHLKNIPETQLENNFFYGATTKNYCFVSEYASFQYLRNATSERLDTLEWEEEKLTLQELINNIFYKIFRGGAVDRYNLEYLYCDLVISLPYKKKLDRKEEWLPQFINQISKSSEKPDLSDLKKLLKTYCKGDRHFLQTVLEALSYAGILKVDDYPVDKIFIPDYRDQLSTHFYSNEWTVPMRFWNT